MTNIQKTFSLIVAILLLNSCASAYQRPVSGDLTGIKHLAVVLKGEPNFKVLNSRATDLGIGVLFGVVGAIANSAYTNSNDSQQQKAMKHQTDLITYRDSFLQLLKNNLQNSKRFEKIDFYDQEIPTGVSPDAVLKLSIEEWGIKVIDEKIQTLVPFIAIEIEMDRKGKALWKERDVQVGRSGHVAGEYQNQENLLRDDFQPVLKDAAYRIASTLIYS